MILRAIPATKNSPKIACRSLNIGANGAHTTHLQKTSIARPKIKEYAIVKDFVPNTHYILYINSLMDTLDEIQETIENQSQKLPLLASDLAVNTQTGEILTEFHAPLYFQTNATDTIKNDKPQSVMAYEKLKNILSQEILPRVFKQINLWGSLPDVVYIQLFLQRFSSNYEVDWQQIVSEDYHTSANYALVLALRDKDDSNFGWHGSDFLLRSGLPEEATQPDEVVKITPARNQAIIFNNVLNSYAVTQLIPTSTKAKQDLLIIAFGIESAPLLSNLVTDRP